MTGRLLVRWLTAAAILALAGAGEARQDASQAELRKLFSGAWRLVSIEGGNAANRGARPTGLIYYDTAGNMAAQIQPDRPRPKYTGTPTAQQALDALSGYIAYFGTYTVDEQAGTVTHHRQGMLDGGDADFVRKYEFAGNRLILTVVGGSGAPMKLTWERAR